MLGGYSRVITAEMDKWLLRCDSNPRLAKRKFSIQQRLERLLPEMRLALQKVLMRTHWSAGITEGRTPRRKGNEMLGLGVHFEVGLLHPGLKWKGFADMVEIGPSGDVTITDFKTGRPKDADEQQVLVYALLWARDSNKNPTGRLASRLLICYPDHTRTVVSPSAAGLHGIEAKLAESSNSIRQVFKILPPPANLSVETCPTCDVRHLCDEYWTERSAIIQDNDASKSYGDCELNLQFRLGLSTWESECSFSTSSLTPNRILVHFSEGSIIEGLRRGDRLRILNTSLRVVDLETPVVTVTPSTEVFKVELVK